MNIKSFIYLIIILGSLSTCSGELDQEEIVLTENLLYASGETVRLSGRVYENNNKPISKHGFEISSSMTFETSNLHTIELGSRERKGQFIGETEGLVNNTQYWYRAFMVIEDQLIYGELKEFNTLNVSVDSFEPKFGYVGNTMTIIGANFSSNTKVFFGNKEAEIMSIELQSIITLKIPKIENNNPQVTIKVVVGDDESSFDTNFEYIYGEWKEIGQFHNNDRFFKSLSMSSNNKFLIGLGKTYNERDFNYDIYEFDLLTQQWQSIPFGGSPAAFPFQNSAGYFGGGVINEWSMTFGSVMVNEFWRYENGEITQVGLLPFSVYKAISYNVDDYVYVFGGYDEFGENTRLIQQFDKSGLRWRQVGEVPIHIDATLPNAISNGVGYFVNAIGEFWQWDLNSDIWTQKGYFPSTSYKAGGVSFVINNKFYAGVFDTDRRLWEYDIENETWKSKTEFPGNILEETSGFYTDNDKLYVIRMSENGNEEFMKIWEFDPEKFN